MQTDRKIRMEDAARVERNINGFGRFALALKVFAMAITAMFVVGSASAQIETQPSWAVLEFANHGDNGTPVGKMATDAITEELKHQGKVDVVPAETVARNVSDLGYQPPITRPAEIQRLGQQLQAVSVISGDVVNWRIVTTAAGKQAQVLLKVAVWDVASGLTVNGAALAANSNVVPGDVSADTLLKSALAQGAFEAMTQVAARTLPSATVLNTLNDRVLINKGSRAGFVKDMRVVVVRGRSQVAEGIVRDVDPDSSFIEGIHVLRGIQPGDRVRTVFDVPEIKNTWTKSGGAAVKRPKSSGNNSGLVSLVIVLLILGFLLSGGHASNQDGVTGVTAEATVLSNDLPVVKVSWTRDSFFRGTNIGAFQFQVFRNGGNGVPATVASKTESFAYDQVGIPFTGVWYDFAGVVGGNTCTFADAPPPGTGTGIAAVAGTPYSYSVEVVYDVLCTELPDACSSSTGSGSTGSTGTTGTTGGGTTGGGNTNLCYFVTSRVPSTGQATPLIRPALRAPDDNAVINAPLTFNFTSVRGAVASIPLEYVVQFSDRQDFAANRTFTTDPVVELVLPGGQLVSSPTINTSTVFPTASVLYWRVGVRNPEDSPGPVADASGQRYIYSSKRHFRRPTNP